MSGLIKSWSYSRYSDYDPSQPYGCPRKAKFKHVDRIREPPNPAMARGTVMHLFAELYAQRKRISYAVMVDEKGKPLCTEAEYKTFRAEWTQILKQPEMKRLFDSLRKRDDVEAEEAWTFIRDWKEPCAWNDWGRAWVRLKVDAHVYDEETKTVRVIDHKTGRIRDTHRDQLSLYAIGSFLMYPEAEKVEAELWYLDQDAATVEDFGRKALPILQKEWGKRVKPMLTDREFKPAPGPKCRWCFYRKDNKANGGGQCEF